MEKKVYRTLVKDEHKLGKNDYVLGRISGIQYMCCYNQPDVEYANTYVPNLGYIISAEFENFGAYSNFRTNVERLYPELCVFDYKG